MLQPILKGIWQILNQTESFLDNLPETTTGFNLSVAISNANGGISSPLLWHLPLGRLPGFITTND